MQQSFIQRPEFPEIPCHCEDHPYRNIVFICLRPDCQIGNRLACPACLLQKHATHLNDLIELKEVYLQTKGEIFTANFPKDSIGQEYKQFSKTQKDQLTHEHIDQVMDKFKADVIDAIEKVRIELKLKISKYEDLFKSSIDDLNSYFLKAYSLEDVRIALDMYHGKDHGLQETNDEIHKFANSEVRFNSLRQGGQELSRFKQSLDTVYLEDVFVFCSKKVLEDIGLLQYTVESSKKRQHVEELVFKKESIPRWIIDLMPNAYDSSMLRERDFDLIRYWLSKKDTKFSLLYRGSRDGMTAQAFHQKCDKRDHTVVICQAKQHEKIFGGYCALQWISSDKGVYLKDQQGFLFSITHQTKHTIYNNAQNAYYCKDSNGPTFGSGHDLMITANFLQCKSNLGGTYQALVGPFNSEEARNHLAGSSVFDLKEIEVYQAEFQQ